MKTNRLERKLLTTHYSLFTRAAFTLIETLVALSVIALAVVGPLSLAATSLSASQIARDQLVAYYLAQEGIEIVRNQRDSNRLSSSDWQNSWFSKCAPNTSCTLFVDGSKSDANNRIPKCSPATLNDCLADGGSKLYYNKNNGLYTHENNDFDSTDFSRAVWVESITGQDFNKKVISVVRWQGRLGRNREVRLIEYLFDLQ